MCADNAVVSQLDRAGPAGSRPGQKRFVSVLLWILVILTASAAWYYYAGTRKIPSAGGLYFFSKLVLPVQWFAQADPRWANDPLGPAPSTMGEEGCAVSSAAMVLSYYGRDIDPGRLNAFLSNNGGYTPQGWLFWEKAAEYQQRTATGDKQQGGALVRKAYEDLPSYYLIDSNLVRGNPVIVRVHLPNGVTHFVVIAGKAGFDYLIQDPASGGVNGVYPLRELAGEIEALRFYERLE